MITTNPYDDPRDKYDSEKWSFPDNDLLYVFVDNYLYKINDTGNAERNNKQIKRLVNIRQSIDQLCLKIIDNLPIDDPELMNGVLIFLDIHCEIPRNQNDGIYYSSSFYKKLKHNNYISSKYLLSELPKNNKIAQQFLGLDVPKLRYIDKHAIPVGVDKNIRCSYREIYINDTLSGQKLKELMLHELSHTIANHQLYRPDDHKQDFKRAENYLKKLASNINF